MGRIINFIRNINYLTKHSLWDRREKDIVYLTDKILDDGIYEYNLNLPGYRKLEIYDKAESIEKIINSGKSYVRFSDGEIRLMMGEDQPFQKYEKELTDRLYNILSYIDENLLVAINRNYFIPGYLDCNVFNRRNSYDFRKFFRKYCNFDVKYLDAACTFHDWGDNTDKTHDFWEKWKNAFEGKDIVIVCGEHILDRLEFDVFEKARSKRFIYGPKINAWNEHGRLINEIKKVDSSSLIVFILGMAGKAMIPEVARLGYTAWDVGHLAKSYNVYRTKIPPTEENISKFYAPD